jgi:hypothetical protein
MSILEIVRDIGFWKTIFDMANSLCNIIHACTLIFDWMQRHRHRSKADKRYIEKRRRAI